MRLNVYSQELITAKGRNTELITKVADETVDGVPLLYSAVRMYLESPERLHFAEGDDDRSGITFWLPKSKNSRERFALILEHMAELVRQAPPETGLD